MLNWRANALALPALLAAFAGLRATAFAGTPATETGNATLLSGISTAQSASVAPEKANQEIGVPMSSPSPSPSPSPSAPQPFSPSALSPQPFSPSAFQPFSPFLFGTETNYWPFWVGQKAPASPDNPFAAAGPTQAWNAAGPFAFANPLDARNRYDDGSTRAQGLRPFYVEKRDANGQLMRVHILFPLFNWTRTQYADGSHGYRWDIFNLINHEHTPARNPTADRPYENQFDIWPFYFSRQTGDPATSHRAVFPIYGNNVTGHLLQDRLDWFLFPLYFRRTLNGVRRTSYLWPVITRTTGDGYDGFSLWPIFGSVRKPGLVDDSFFLWPFHFHSIRTDPDTGGVTDRFAVLPFYYSETAPGLRAESFMLLWGYSHRAAPVKYDEYRYLWPLWLRTRGDNIRRDRFAPFYTHSIVDGKDKTWVLWPVWNRLSWNDDNYRYRRTRFLFLFYHDITQKPLPWPGITPEQKAKLDAAPPARRTNLWPLFTYWSDGLGRRQFQLLSPLEVFLPANEPTRLIYTPFFALYRYEQAAPGHYRHSLLWNFITCRREPGLAEFHLGPLYSGERVGDYKRRALFCGVLGLQKTPGKGWRPFAFKFKTLQRQLAEKNQQTAAQTAAQTTVAQTTPRDYPQVRRRM